LGPNLTRDEVRRDLNHNLWTFQVNIMSWLDFLSVFSRMFESHFYWQGEKKFWVLIAKFWMWFCLHNQPTIVEMLFVINNTWADIGFIGFRICSTTTLSTISALLLWNLGLNPCNQSASVYMWEFVLCFSLGMCVISTIGMRHYPHLDVSWKNLWKLCYIWLLMHTCDLII